MNRLESLIDKGYIYKEEKALFVRKWIENRCTHVKGELRGQPLILPEYFYTDIINPVFGLYQKNGNRLKS